MSRFSDVLSQPAGGALPPLPVVDFRRVDREAPRPAPVSYTGPDGPLPEADVAVLTWTTAEWSALDHVFVNPGTSRTREERDWSRSWHQYSRGAPAPAPDQQTDTGPLWGYYQLVDVPGAGQRPIRVLLFKADTHLAHPPWYAGLADMISQLTKESQVSMVYSIGTAGGARADQHLGDVVVTNAAHLRLQNPHNSTAGINDQTFTCPAGFPATTLLDTVSAQLMLPLSGMATFPRLSSLVSQLRQDVPAAGPLTLDDLLSPGIDPRDLHHPAPVPMPGTPLLTTDYYYIADGTDAEQWAVLEMDDAVIAYVAGQLGVDYAFVRNISDPVVPMATPDAAPLSDEVRSRWSSLIYTEFGLYTSFNGAITSWATIAATG